MSGAAGATSRALVAVGRLVRGLRAHGGLEAAAAIAFWFFLSLVPLLALLGYLVVRVARARGIDALVVPLLEVVPDTAEDIVRKEVERMAGSGATFAPLGAIGFFWTASSGLHSLMDVFETTSGVTPRPWWKQRAIALGWVTMGLVAACALAWSLVRIDVAVQSYGPPPAAKIVQVPPASTTAQAAPPPHAGTTAKGGTVSRARGALKRRVRTALHTPLEEAIASVLLLALGLTLLAGFYRFAVEHAPGVRRRVWPGTLVAVASWLVVSWFFGLYVVSMPSYALYYGSLAAVAVMLVWLYLTSLSLVVGAEVNANLELEIVVRARAARSSRGSTPTATP